MKHDGAKVLVQRRKGPAETKVVCDGRVFGRQTKSSPEVTSSVRQTELAACEEKGASRGRSKALVGERWAATRQSGWRFCFGSKAGLAQRLHWHHTSPFHCPFDGVFWNASTTTIDGPRECLALCLNGTCLFAVLSVQNHLPRTTDALWRNTKEAKSAASQRFSRVNWPFVSHQRRTL
jgi:hypothetical protein